MTIKDYPPSRRPTWRLVSEELLAAAAAGLLIPMGLSRDKRRTPRQQEQRTLVMVHGYMANRSTLLPLASDLRLRGFSQVLYFSYSSGQGIEPAARALREHLQSHVRGGRIDLICHSMGGLVARVYLQDLGGMRRVDHCITLCTPHRGTYNSYWVPSRVGRELRPDSPLLERLNSTMEACDSVRFLSISGGSDNIVVPRVFASHADELHIPDLGHIGILFSPRVFRAVADRLLEE